MPVYRTELSHSSAPFYSRITGYLDLIAQKGKIELSDLVPERNPYDDRKREPYDNSAWRDLLLVRGGKPLLAILVLHSPGSAAGLAGYINAPSYGGVGPLAGRTLDDVSNSITDAMKSLPDTEEVEKVDETAYRESEWRILVRVPGQPNKLFKGGPFDIPKLEEAFVYISQQIVAAVGSVPAP